MVDEQVRKAIREALERAKPRKFVESVELAIALKDLDLTQPKNRLQEEVALPKGRGKPIRVVVFASGELAVKAKPVADLVIQPDEIETLASPDRKRETKKMVRRYDFFVAEAPLMPVIGRRLGQILGPLGKMPRPIPPTLDPAGLVETLKRTVRLRSKDKPVVHVPIGVRTMSEEDLVENYEAVLKRVRAKLERGQQNIASIHVKTSMGPAVRIQ